VFEREEPKIVHVKLDVAASKEKKEINREGDI